jgi:hypothetical protein
MKPSDRTTRLGIGVLVLMLGFLASSCGSGSDYAGGGTGGTGISTGSITAFGSVVVNGVHFRTDGDVAPAFRTKKVSNGVVATDCTVTEVFAVGMIVTVRHGTADNNASEIDYWNNVMGPVSATVPGADNVIEVLGQTVVVDNAEVFSSLKQNDVVEVSGYADDVGRIRATSVVSLSSSNRDFEVNGYVSKRSGSLFQLGPLPDGSGATLTVSIATAEMPDLPGGPANGMYVHVTTDKAPVNSVVNAVRIERIASRTEFPDQAVVDLEGLITTPWGGVQDDLSFAVAGKRVLWNAATAFDGDATEEGLGLANRKVHVHGTENGGTLSAARIEFR